MNWRDYVAERQARDPEFKAAWEETRPQFEFRRALVMARIEAGLTQREMAERLGVKQAAVARWEAGETMPTLDTLFRVAKALELDFTVTPDAPLVVTPHRVREAAAPSG
jgi:transcriptional regulator with XRE-family HTH domain